MTGWMAVLATLVYICGLFAVAHYGDTSGRRFLAGRVRPIVYALGLCVYCTSWTFFGSVGVASSSGYDFLAIYIGPLLVIGFGGPALARIVHLAKGQNITIHQVVTDADNGESSNYLRVSDGVPQVVLGPPDKAEITVTEHPLTFDATAHPTAVADRMNPASVGAKAITPCNSGGTNAGWPNSTMPTRKRLAVPTDRRMWPR